MPTIIETVVYTFDELSDEAKEKARDYARIHWQVYGWSECDLASVQMFCKHFGVTLKTWCVGPYMPVEYSHDADNSNFRGVKLASIDREYMPTGYTRDCDLWHMMHDEFKRTGDAKHSFDAAVYAGLRAWRDDWESALGDSELDEFLIVNAYQYTESGDLFYN